MIGAPDGRHYRRFMSGYEPEPYRSQPNPTVPLYQQSYQQPAQVQPYYQPVPVPMTVVTVGQPTSGMATASLVLGILGFFSCGMTSLFAVILGHIAERQTARGTHGGRGQAIAGLVLGWIVMAPAVVFLFLMIIGVASAPFASTAH